MDSSWSLDHVFWWLNARILIVLFLGKNQITLLFSSRYCSGCKQIYPTQSFELQLIIDSHKKSRRSNLPKMAHVIFTRKNARTRGVWVFFPCIRLYRMFKSWTHLKAIFELFFSSLGLFSSQFCSRIRGFLRNELEEKRPRKFFNRI